MRLCTENVSSSSGTATFPSQYPKGASEGVTYLFPSCSTTEQYGAAKDIRLSPVSSNASHTMLISVVENICLVLKMAIRVVSVINRRCRVEVTVNLTADVVDNAAQYFQESECQSMPVGRVLQLLLER